MFQYAVEWEVILAGRKGTEILSATSAKEARKAVSRMLRKMHGRGSRIFITSATRLKDRKPEKVTLSEHQRNSLHPEYLRSSQYGR